MLGLEEGGGKDEHTSSIQGGYLSFLYLRHLRIRDLQRTVSTTYTYIISLYTLLIYSDVMSVLNKNISSIHYIM